MAAHSKRRWSPRRRKIPSSIENYLRVLGLLYLFIGLFIFVRRWNAPRADAFLHFLPGLIYPVQLPLQRQAEFLRLRLFIGAAWWRCCCSPPCWCISRWCSRNAVARCGRSWQPFIAFPPRSWRCTSSSPPARWISCRHLARATGWTRLNRSTWGCILSWPRSFSFSVFVALLAECCASN